MTQIFRGGTTNKLALQYAERKKYRQYLLDTGYDFLDTLYQKSLYGFINKDYEVVAPTPDLTIFGDYSPGAEGLTFVVNQFNKFRDHYLSKAAEGNYTVPSLITDLVPSVSFVDYEQTYAGSIDSYRSLLSNKTQSSRVPTVTSFESFIRFYHGAIFDVDVRGLPATHSGFMLSPDASVYNTGLYVDLGQGQSPEIDQQKADFIADDGFLCFMEISNKFGFYIDGNYPWRLAVNLNSGYTRSLLMNGRPTPMFDNFYSDTFTMKVGRDDYWAIVKLYKELFISYSQLATINLLDNFAASITTELWLETLLLHKFNELGLMKSPERTNLFKETYQKTLDSYNRYGLSSISGAIGFINSFSAEQLKNKVLGQP